MTDKLNLTDTIAKDDKFSTFSRLMASTGTSRVISAAGPFTVFAPTNDAFAKITEAKIVELLNETDQTTLKSILGYHILPGAVMAANLVSAPTRKAFTGAELTFTDTNGLKVNGASIQARNLEATNGVVHALDTVLTPTSAPKSADATTAPLVTPTAIASSALTAVPTASPSATPTTPTPVASPSLSAVPAMASAATASVATTEAKTKSIL